MQQDKNDMEEKLRQLDKQQLPDLSHMDEHWYQFRQGLAPVADTPVVNSARYLPARKILFFAASITGIFFLVLLLLSNDPDKRISSEKQRPGHVLPIVAENSIHDTLTKSPPGSKNSNIPAVLSGTPIYADVMLNSYDAGILDSLQFVSEAPLTPVSSQKILDNFYDEVQKAAQEFTLSAEKGGQVICAEGTKLVIPASAFVDETGKSISGEVKIIVVEYYKYSEMIAANLTTMSDGRQLITGGMVRITAQQEGRSVELRNDKAINLSMPVKDYDEAMQLFVSGSETNKKQVSFTVDSIADGSSSSPRYRNINWQQSSAQSSMPVFDGKTLFINLANDPYEETTSRRGKTTAKFAIPRNSGLSVEEATNILTEKYGYYYDKIKVKKVRRKQTSYKDPWENVQVGDSVRLTLDQAIRWKYIERKDSALYAKRIKQDSINFYKRYFAGLMLGNELLYGRRLFGGEIITIGGRKSDRMSQDSLTKYYELYLKTQQTYSFRIQNLGWINCDKFSNYSNKADFVINLPQGVNADKFVSQLVFTTIRSVLPGRMYENKIGFLNVPVNMPVYVVGLGEKDGKVVSFLEKLSTGKNEVDVINFEETTSEAFKKKLAVLDLQ